MSEQCKCYAFFFDGLLMIFLHFVCKLVPGMRKHHVTTMLPKLFYLGLLTSKNQFEHAFLPDIALVRLTVFRPFQGGGGGAAASRPSSSCLCCLLSMLTCFLKHPLPYLFDIQLPCTLP